MRIGELAERCGTGPKAIRYYEAIGLVPEPPRLPNGYRDYGEEAVDLLRFISAAQSIGLSLDEIRDVLALREGGEAPCEHVLQLIDRHAARLEERIRAMEEMRGQLLNVASRGRRSLQRPGTFCCIIEDASVGFDARRRAAAFAIE